MAVEPARVLVGSGSSVVLMRIGMSSTVQAVNEPWEVAKHQFLVECSIRRAEQVTCDDPACGSQGLAAYARARIPDLAFSALFS